MRVTAVSLSLLVVCVGFITAPVFGAEVAAVHMANGVKIGELTQSTAAVWTRLTAAPEGNTAGFPFPETADPKRPGVKPTMADLTGGHPLDAMEGSAAGVEGMLRLVYWAEDAPDMLGELAWTPVDPAQDFTRQFVLKGLRPGTRYRLRAEGKPADADATMCVVEGGFRTAPAASDAAAVSFVVVTGQDYHRRDDPEKGHRIYPAMQALDPDFFVHTGDIEYYDKAGPYAINQELARFKWNRIYAMPNQRAFHNHVSSYFIKDDHDTLKNDCWPSRGATYGDLSWEQGLAIFREQVPMGEKTYRTIRWGKDLQVWLVEGRDYRSPNTMRDGPEKTIWGAEQKAWFKRTVLESDATFRVLISPTPLVGPDRDSKRDNHANAVFAYEGNELRTFMAAQKNMMVVAGDRHWQYVSVDDETGLHEFASGPSSNAHAGGWKQEDLRPEHRYLNVTGGFLHVAVRREADLPSICFRHYAVTGELYNEVVIPAP